MPVALVAWVVVLIVMPKAMPIARGAVDYAGATLLVIGLTGLLGWISFVETHIPLGSPASILFLGGSLVVLVAALVWEWRRDDAASWRRCRSSVRGWA